MAMSFPFLMLGDIDEVWEEMIECKPKLGGINHAKVDQFVEYFEKTWINDHQLNGQIQSYKIVTLTQKQESLASTTYERVNLGKNC